MKQLLQQKGQAVVVTVLLLGAILASITILAAKRNANISKITAKAEAAQLAQEVLSSAAKILQRRYAQDAGCDPATFRTGIAAGSNLPTNPDDLGLGPTGMDYVLAQASGATSADRQNRCTSATGCRQLAFALRNRVYIVTIGAVLSDSPSRAIGTACPRDVTVRLSVVIASKLFHRKVTLLNICTTDDCGTNTADNSKFIGMGVSVTGGTNVTFLSTQACPANAGNSIASRYYGSITNSTNGIISIDDYRWAKRYLETGGGETGETTFMQATIAWGNGSCVSTSSNNQCVGRNCIPAFDLNYDQNNSEADLAILEYFLRGYLMSLPVNQLN